MTVWFTSDLHLFHRAVSYQRRYGSWPADRSLVTEDDVAWHNTTLAENWDRVVRRDDTVWVLGDLTANDKNIHDALDWIRQRPGAKHFIAGNHDPCHPMHRDAHAWQSVYMTDSRDGQYRKAFYSVQAFAKRVVKVDGGKLTLRLSHFPYEADHPGKESRFDEYRLRPVNDALLLHGHTHSSSFLTSPTEMHIGVDAWDLTPVSLDTITAGGLEAMREAWNMKQRLSYQEALREVLP